MLNESLVSEVNDWLKDQPPMLTIAKVAELLGCSQRQVHRYLAQERLKSIRLSEGRSTKRLIPRKFLAEFIASCAV